MELPEDQAKIVSKMAAVQARQQQNKVEQESNQANGDRLAAELEELAQELAEAKKVTYSIGDRFRGSTGKCMLTRIGTDKYGIVSLSTGNYYYGTFKAPANEERITPAELSIICSSNLTRYWDARKKENCQ